ncbi:branched-chain amino acid ABC transporter ATP-binding protein [Pollutimonas nitritireducens]|uniref:Branched-chain amino acid ABC transporter ATP-binding protein n=1 Tax=Pollutimonas nitritireducens TaxID=2045209 RepID=A0A2N4UHG7_9BURK|nr:ABC transporter ATP-binding protein [Pollutimonas nitritireducens]PLC54448.1 branched-chain amino acid ABC transporter ATP-binding protein [Pollutimonas nitritireducens]
MIDVEGVRAGFGAINILWDVSVSARKGELTTIIGPNGAGKTTLLRAIMGLIPLEKGSVRLDGKVLDGTPTWKMPELGMVMIPEGRMIFKDMTIEENLMLGAFSKGHRAGSRRQCDRAYEMFPRLGERRGKLAGTLSGGEAQMLAMSRGLMSDPDVLLIDEPSLGLAPVVVNELFETLARLKSEGRTIILVEQSTHRAVGVADHVYLMQSGKVVLSQRAGDVDMEHLHDLYFAH